jgi:hypothetical protein
MPKIGLIPSSDVGLRSAERYASPFDSSLTWPEAEALVGAPCLRRAVPAYLIATGRSAVPATVPRIWLVVTK